MVVSRRSVQTNQTTSNSNYQHLHQALSSTGIKIAGVSLLVVASFVIATIESNNTESTTASPPAASTKSTASTSTANPPVQPLDTATDEETGTATNNNDSTVEVTVNGQSIAVPMNGTTQHTVADSSGNSTTQVQVSHQSSQAGSSNSFSSTSVSSHSFSSGNGYNMSYTLNNGVPMP